MADSPDPIGPGGRLTYVIEVSNNGDTDAQDVEIRTGVPEFTTFADADPNAVLEGGNDVVWRMSSLTAGNQATFTLQVVVDFPTVAENSIFNAVEVTAAPPAQSADSGAITGIRPLGVNLTVATRPTGCVGSLLRAYEVLFLNGGDTPLSGLRLSAEVPPGTTLNYVDGGVAMCSPTLDPPEPPTTACSSDPNCPCVLFWDIGTLGTGQLDFRDFGVKVEPDDPPAGTFLESSVLLTNGVESGTSSVRTQIQDSPCPGLEKIDRDPLESAVPGGRVRYLISARNVGRLTEPNAELLDPVPVGTEFGTADPNRCLDPNSPGPKVKGTELPNDVIRWDLPAVAPNEQVTVCLELDVRPDIGAPSIVNAAGWSSQTATASIPVQTVSALKLTKEAEPSPVEVDEQLKYTIRLENVSDPPLALTDVVITDDLQNELTPLGCVSLDPNATEAECGQIPDDPNGVLTWNIPFLAAGLDVERCFVVNINEACAGERLVNLARARDDDRDEDAAAIARTRIQGVGKIALRLLKQTPGQAKIKAGDDVVFTLRVQNRLEQDLADVTVTDDQNAVTPPGALEFSSANPSDCGGTGPAGSEAGGVVTWLFPTLAPGEETVCLRATTSRSLAESTLVRNTAEADDPNGNHAEDTVGTRIFAKALRLELNDNPDPVVRDNQLRYLIRVTNLGNQDLEGISVKTRVPAGTELECLSGSNSKPGDCAALNDPNSNLGLGVTLDRDPSDAGIRGRRVLWAIDALPAANEENVRQMEMVVKPTKRRWTIRAVAKVREQTLRSREKARALTVVVIPE
jgi:uncharacterized repeat protein (TIGR01451 family)